MHPPKASPSTLELLVAPNNPTGIVGLPNFRGECKQKKAVDFCRNFLLLMESLPPGSTVIHDAVFKWPMYTDKYEAMGPDHPMTIFSMSKLTGHAGSR